MKPSPIVHTFFGLYDLQQKAAVATSHSLTFLLKSYTGTTRKPCRLTTRKGCTTAIYVMSREEVTGQLDLEARA